MPLFQIKHHQPEKISSTDLIQTPMSTDPPPTTSNSLATPPVMDPGMWSNLPQDLLELILSFLPLKSLMSLRSTCKHFKSLFFSQSIISKHSSSSPCFTSFLLLSHRHSPLKFPLYDSALGAWRDFSLSLSALLPSAAGQGASLLSASNGLLCFSLSDSFFVFNLLARSSRVIEFPAYPFTFQFLSLVSTPLGYKIFTLSSDSAAQTSFVYDSKVQSWKKFTDLEPILCDNYHQRGVYFKGPLYFLTADPISVVCFDLENGKWEKPKSELPEAEELMFARLVRNGGEEGKLFMIGGIGENGISRIMKLWEADEGLRWVEVETLPEIMCRKLVSVCFHNYENLYCFWHQGLLCVCCYTWPEIMYYDVSKRTWHWLLKCNSLPEKWSCGFRWFSYVPELYAEA